MQEQPQPDIAMTIITAASEGLSDRLAKTEEGQKVLDVVRDTLTQREVDPATTDKIVKIIAEDPVFIRTQSNPVDDVLTRNLAVGIAEFGQKLQVDLSPEAQKAMFNDAAAKEPMKSAVFNLEETLRRRDANNQLAQFLGVSLRAVLPYAQSEYEAISDVARRDNDEVARAEARVAGRAVTRANHALKELEASELNINDLEDDSLDEDFQVVFEDEDVDPTDD